MAKEKKQRVPKVEKKATPPKLAAFVDSPIKIYLVMGKKEREATILSTGLIRFDETEYKSPCAAATAMAKAMGEEWTLNAWASLKYNRDGERVSIDTLRGAKSPLKAVVAKPKKVKAAKVTKPKAARKPRAKKSKANGSAVETHPNALESFEATA